LRGTILTLFRVLPGRTSLRASEVEFLPNITGTVMVASAHVTSSSSVRFTMPSTTSLRYHQKKGGALFPPNGHYRALSRHRIAVCFNRVALPRTLRRFIVVVCVRYYAFYSVFTPSLEKMVSFSRSTDIMSSGAITLR